MSTLNWPKKGQLATSNVKKCQHAVTKKKRELVINDDDRKSDSLTNLLTLVKNVSHF